MKYIFKKPLIIEVTTFEEFVKHADSHWSFDFQGFPVTHENDECYLIPTKDGVLHFTVNDVLYIEAGVPYIWNKDRLELNYLAL